MAALGLPKNGSGKTDLSFFFNCFFVQPNIIVPAENLENIDTGRKENVQNDFSGTINNAQKLEPRHSSMDK